MKKLVSMYQKYMFRPILYKSVTRVSVVAVLMLLWDRYVSDGTFTMWQAPALLLGVVLLAWAWVNYLRLDGVTIHHLGEEFKDMGKKKKKLLVYDLSLIHISSKDAPFIEVTFFFIVA